MRLLTALTVGFLTLGSVPALSGDAAASSSTSTSVSTDGITIVTESDGKTTRVYTASPDGEKKEITGLDQYRVSTEGNKSIYELPDGTRLEITSDAKGNRVEVRTEKRVESRVEEPRPVPKDPEARIRDLEERVRQLERERAVPPRGLVPDLPPLTPDPPKVWRWDSPELKEFQFRLGPEGRLLTPDTRRDIERAIEEAQRSLREAMKRYQDLSPKQREEMQKSLKDAMPEVRKSIEGAIKELEKTLKRLQQTEKGVKEI
jgi:hypothetical protein